MDNLATINSKERNENTKDSTGKNRNETISSDIT